MHKFFLLLLLPLMLGALCACRREAPLHNRPIPSATSPTGETGRPLYDEEAPLLGSAETQKEAEEIGTLYGITLVKFSHGTALYQTEEDPREVIRRGRENGWPELSLNYLASPL